MKLTKTIYQGIIDLSTIFILLLLYRLYGQVVYSHAFDLITNAGDPFSLTISLVIATVIGFSVFYLVYCLLQAISWSIVFGVKYMTYVNSFFTLNFWFFFVLMCVNSLYLFLITFNASFNRVFFNQIFVDWIYYVLIIFCFVFFVSSYVTPFRIKYWKKYIYCVVVLVVAYHIVVVLGNVSKNISIVSGIVLFLPSIAYAREYLVNELK